MLVVGGTRGLAEEEADSATWPKIYRSGPSHEKYAALTFDDAPLPGLEELLGILEDLDVRATFFVEGVFASWRPHMLKAIADAGHEIGNHTYDHPDMTRVSDEELGRQLDLANQIIESQTGITPHLFRPPGGRHDSRVVDAAYERELTTVLWTVSCSDYREPSPAYIVDRVLSGVRPGGIILLHDGVGSTREALPEIVRTLRGRGYVFVTVGEMLEMTHGKCPWVGEAEESSLASSEWHGF
jgi:peptidoglycan/xylan/chitin deacetylase (PgdA/CDA1 family)